MKTFRLLPHCIAMMLVVSLFCIIPSDAHSSPIPRDEDLTVQSHIYDYDAEAAAAANAEWQKVKSAAISVAMRTVTVGEPREAVFARKAKLFESGKPDPLIDAIETVVDDLYIEVLRFETTDSYSVRGSGKIIKEIWEGIDEIFE